MTSRRLEAHINMHFRRYGLPARQRLWHLSRAVGGYAAAVRLICGQQAKASKDSTTGVCLTLSKQCLFTCVLTRKQFSIDSAAFARRLVQKPGSVSPKTMGLVLATLQEVFAQ